MKPSCLIHGLICVASCVLASCDTSQKRAIRELTESGVEVSGRSLVHAVLEHDAGRTALLLEAGVFTEQRDSKGRTVLGIAVENNDLATVVMLLNANANVNATIDGQTSILGMAAEQSAPNLIATLIGSGARTDGLMPDGDKILPWAIRKGRADLVRMLMNADSDPHLKDRQGNPLLHIAMEAGRRDLMESLIELGADPGATNSAGETTIHLALRQGWSDVISKLAAAGADPNATDPTGYALLEQAYADGDRNRIALYLKIGADPNLHNPAETSSPLQKAFDRPDPLMFETFLKHGAKPPQGNWDPWIWPSLRSHDPTKARLLFASGALPSHPVKNGLSLVETATIADDADLVKLMLDYHLPAGRSLYFATLGDNYNLVDLLLACGVSPNFTPVPSKDTLLCMAIRLQHDRIAERLLRAGASAEILPSEGQSCFHFAVVRGCPLTVKYLLNSGANPNAPFSLPVSSSFLKRVRPGAMRWVLKFDQNGTPLMAAADSGNIQTVRHLIKAGAKINVRTQISQLWPLNFASNRGDVRMMRVFLGKDPYREERIIEIRLSEQCARVFDAEGNEIFYTKVSTGRPGFSTRPGEYVITNKHREWTSTLYHASMPYFQRLSCGDFGMHQGVVPGHPASHGCIRVPAGNASKLFGMTETGDRVRILK